MKKAQKNFLGLFGLSAVVIMTIIAVNIPGPGAAAATSTLTDTIEVRVVGNTPDVEILGIRDEAIYTNPERPFQISFENVDTYVLTLIYTDLNGNISTDIIDQAAPDYEYGVADYIIRLTE